ncbi:hypothetical protein ABIE52_006811 [Rhodococcus sp. OAS809]|uniref:LppP/LprE family lipoprotein n=1 Tax=Rhodococcus sp. OAS809 TaxID=2663874 RepID=UPI00178BF37B
MTTNHHSPDRSESPTANQYLRRCALTFSVAAVLVSSIAACSSDGDASAPPSQTSTIASVTTPPAFPASSAPATPAATAAPEVCDTNADMTDAVASAVGTLAAPSTWSWQKNADTSSLNPCAALSFATTTIDRATNSSPVAILLFHHGEFVGPASTCYATISAVESASDDTVAVTYRYPEPGDSNAGMTGRANYTFTWNDGKVEKVGTMPARLSELMDCTL